MTIDEYNQSFLDLFREAKTVSHCSDRPEVGHMSSSEFCHRTRLLLAELSDDDLKAVANKIKPTKYFNVVIQAHWAAVNLEAKERGWECLI
jgi:hypothetical protein